MSENHPILITHSHKEEAAFSTVDSDLSNQLIKKLTEKFFADLADTMLTSVLLVQSVVQLLLQVGNVNLGGGLW